MKVYSVRRLLALMMSAMLVLSLLSGCGKKDNEEQTPPPNDGVQDGQQTVIPGYEDGPDTSGDVSFGLQDPGDPTFSDIATGEDDGLYTIENGYAYALDPTTFDKTGPALDPITHEVVDPQPQFDADGNLIQDGEGEGNTEQLPPEGEGGDGTESQTPPDTVQTPPPVVTIPEGQKLPNTGIFLEDD